MNIYNITRYMCITSKILTILHMYLFIDYMYIYSDYMWIYIHPDSLWVKNCCQFCVVWPCTLQVLRACTLCDMST